MHKLTLVLFATLIFFTTASYAEEQDIEALQAKIAEVQNKLNDLQESNTNLKKKLASYENEIAGWRAALENIEGEIATMNETGGS